MVGSCCANKPQAALKRITRECIWFTIVRNFRHLAPNNRIAFSVSRIFANAGVRFRTLLTRSSHKRSGDAAEFGGADALADPWSARDAPIPLPQKRRQQIGRGV